MIFKVLTPTRYRPSDGPANSADALDRLTTTYTPGPNAFVLLGAACMIGYRLTRARTVKICQELDRCAAPRARGVEAAAA